MCVEGGFFFKISKHDFVFIREQTLLIKTKQLRTQLCLQKDRASSIHLSKNIQKHASQVLSNQKTIISNTHLSKIVQKQKHAKLCKNMQKRASQFFWTQFKNVHLQGPCSTEVPMIILRYFACLNLNRMKAKVYSRVHISSNKTFFKIMKNPTIVLK